MGVDGGVVWCLIMTSGFKLVLGACKPLLASQLSKNLCGLVMQVYVFPGKQDMFLAH